MNKGGFWKSYLSPLFCSLLSFFFNYTILNARHKYELVMAVNGVARLARAPTPKPDHVTNFLFFIIIRPKCIRRRQQAWATVPNILATRATSRPIWTSSYRRTCRSYHATGRLLFVGVPIHSQQFRFNTLNFSIMDRKGKVLDESQDPKVLLFWLR